MLAGKSLKRASAAAFPRSSAPISAKHARGTVRFSWDFAGLPRHQKIFFGDLVHIVSEKAGPGVSTAILESLADNGVGVPAKRGHHRAPETFAELAAIPAVRALYVSLEDRLQRSHVLLEDLRPDNFRALEVLRAAIVKRRIIPRVVSASGSGSGSAVAGAGKPKTPEDAMQLSDDGDAKDLADYLKPMTAEEEAAIVAKLEKHAGLYIVALVQLVDICCSRHNADRALPQSVVETALKAATKAWEKAGFPVTRDGGPLLPEQAKKFGLA